MLPRAWTIADLLQETQRYFETCGIQSARLDAELLLAHALGKKRLRLYLEFDQPVTEQELSRFRELVRRRAKREPVAYITGHKEFWSLSLQVDRSVLIPRPETEVLVEAALAVLRENFFQRTAPVILDLGTGSGAVALAIAHEIRHAVFVAVDCSIAALRVARRNIREYGCEKRVQPVCGDWGSMFADRPVFDLIVANPPYIATPDLAALAPDIKDYEPREALDGGPDGLAFYRAWLPRLSGMLRPGGWIALEIGDGQSDRVLELFQQTRLLQETRFVPDLAHRQRIVLAQKKA